MEPLHALASLDRRLWAEAKRFQSEGKDSGDAFRGLWIDDADANGLKANKQSPQTLNMKLRRILGLESTFDFRTALHDLLFN